MNKLKLFKERNNKNFLFLDSSPVLSLTPLFSVVSLKAYKVKQLLDLLLFLYLKYKYILSRVG